MFYVVDYLTNPELPDPEEGPFLEIHEEDIDIPGAPAWQTGDPFEEELETPIVIEATPHRGYVGAPHDFFDGVIAFVSPRLLEVLRRAGVDGMQTFPAVVRYRTNGEQHDVFAVNLLGLVPAVALGGSNASSADGDFRMDTSIEGFEVDASSAEGRGMFRLAENCMTVVVHERIKDAIVAAGINTFAFVAPEDWVQL
jgi:hypothetical protein